MSSFLAELVESALERAVADCAPEKKLREAILYSVFPPGKRIRPMLALSICLDLGGDPARIAQAAAALELIHCASLVHDDLPALDNDDMRRGRPSCHKQFGEATAILAADYMIGQSFQRICRADVSASAKVLMLDRLGRTFLDLCDGQQMDLDMACDGELISKVHRLKTGALFACSVYFGAVGAGKLGEELEEFWRFGEQLGLGFQICNDFDDVHGGANVNGRRSGSDIKNDKPTIFNKLSSDTRRRIISDVSGGLDRFVSERAAELPLARSLCSGVLEKLREISAI